MSTSSRFISRRLRPEDPLAGTPPAVGSLFCVASGSGWVAGPDSERKVIMAGQVVLWPPGEEHESGSDEGMTVVSTQATVRLPYG